MSFLARRLAGTEGAFFAQQSKNAVSRLKEKIGNVEPSKNRNSENASDSGADILPEILRHSVPVCPADEPTSSMRAQSSAWSSKLSVGDNNSNLAHEMNPLNALVSVPRATFGPKRWSLPSDERALLASTANEVRQDHTSSPDAEKMKAAMDGVSAIGKAFAVATGIIFGGATLIGIIATKKFELHSVEGMSKAWHLDENKHRATSAEFAQGLGMKAPNAKREGD